MKKKLAVAVVFLIAFLIASVVLSAERIRAAGPQREPPPSLFAGSSAAAAVFQRSCANCHSNETRWPWYSYVPPSSWLVVRDVEEARHHFNASQWPAYRSEEKSELLADVARVVANREMPPRPYLLLHREARLLDGDAEALIVWAGGVRRSLRVGVRKGGE